MTAPAPRPYRLRRRLLVLVAMLVGLVATSAAATVITAVAARRAIASAHRFEEAARQAQRLSSLAREQYIHEAHTVILGDRSHVDHHDEWVARLRGEADRFRADVDEEGARQLEALQTASRRLDETFSEVILPAIDKGDREMVRAGNELATDWVDLMTSLSDELATRFSDRAVSAEEDAERIARAAQAGVVALCVAALLAAGLLARWLWRSLALPLGSLQACAERVAADDREARVERIGAVELDVVGRAFNKMLDELSRAQRERLAAERLAVLGRVAAGVAHEINNPIAVIRGYVKTLREESGDPRLREELCIIDEEAAACQRIGEDLLIYARSPAVTPAEVDAGALLGEAAERSRAHDDGGAPVEVDAEPARLAVDPLRIRQVVVNLVRNARAAGEPGEPVVLRGRVVEATGYRIEVLDRGQGLPEESRDRLFEPFFTTRGDGAGLGLAVCYGLVTAHGGTIRGEAREGGGSRFVVELPGVVRARGGAHTGSPRAEVST